MPNKNKSGDKEIDGIFTIHCSIDKNGEYGKAIIDFMKGIEVELSRNSNV